MNYPQNLSIIVFGVVAIAITGCQQKNEFIEPPPPKVTVNTPDKRDVTVFMGLPGRLQAQDSINIRARISGYLQSVDFEDGVMVEKGDQLFVIEPGPYIASTKAAAANLAQAKAAKNIAQTNYDRREQAYKTKAVSEIDLLTAKANLDSAEAAILVAEAQLTQSQIDLSYTTNTAPATGRIARRLVSVGNLVGGSDSTLLTTLVVQDPIHVYFNVNERLIVPKLAELAQTVTESTIAQLADNELEPEQARDMSKSVPVLIELADGSRYDGQGFLDFIDNRVDPETGTVTARAIFRNEEGALLPGLYAKVLIPDLREKAILVPDLAVLRDIGGSYVLIVNDEDKVESRYVTPGPKVDDERIIEEGLDGSERVVIQGVQRARPGIVVDAEQAKAESDNEPKTAEIVDENA